METIEIQPEETTEPKDERAPLVLPQTTVERFQRALNELTVTQTDQRYASHIAEDFSHYIVDQKDFYKFSIDFLLDPAKSFLKNFSIITAQPGSGGQAQTPNIIQV